MQLTGARPKTSGYRKLENVLGSFPSDLCPHSPALGKQEISVSKRIRRVLLAWGAVIRCPSQSRVRKISAEGCSERTRWAQNIFLWYKVSQCSKNAGDTSKDTEASVKGHPLVSSKWCCSSVVLPSPGRLVSICVGSMGDWVWTDSKRQWPMVDSLRSPSSRVSATVGCFLHCYSPFLATGLPRLLDGHDSGFWYHCVSRLFLQPLWYSSFLLLLISKLSSHSCWVSRVSY